MKATLSPDERSALSRQFEDLARRPPFNVLARDFLQELAKVESPDEPIVSLYLDLSPQNRLRKAWASHLKSLTQKAVASLEDGRAEAVARDLERIERELDQSLPEMGRGVAFFVSDGLGLWQQIPLPLAFPNRLEIGNRPYIRPLLLTQDENERVGVALVDQRRARLLVSQLGSIQEVADIFEDTPKHHKQGGWSQMRFQRHHEAHVLWHAGAVAYGTYLMMEKFRIRHLLVSGPPQVLSEYREHLPAAVTDRLVGDVNVSLDSSISEIAEAIEPMQHELEAREEVRTIEELREAATAGPSVWGLPDTLRAIIEQRVMTLVVREGYVEAGGSCEHCGNLSVEGESDCPVCGAEIHGTDDVVELAMARALIQGAELELVRSQRAQQLLDENGPIGARLRY